MLSVPLLKGLPNRRELLLGLRSPWIWAVLLLSLALDYAAWRMVRSRVAMETRSLFDRRVDEIRGAVLSRMVGQEVMLRGAAGLYAASERLERHEWREYVASLRLDRSLAGAQGLGFAARVPPGGEAAFEARARREGFEDFRIWPDTAAGERTAILYLEPSDSRNRRAFGFDMFTEPIRREAMERARDHGEAAITGRVVLVQEYEWDPEPQPGFLMYLPVYSRGRPVATVEQRREALVGYVYSPFRMGDLMAHSVPRLKDDDVGFAIYDGRRMDPLGLLFRSRNYREAGTGPGGSLLEQVETIALHGHHWTFRFSAGPAFPGADAQRPDLVLGLGLLISLLLAGGILILVTTRQRAQRLAETMTAELRALQDGLEKQVTLRTRELEAANRDLAAEMERRIAREEQLRQAQKMEAIGRLAGGIAHDFNNLLTAINGYTALTVEMLEPDSPLRSNLEEIRRAGEMAASLTRQLLAYSRKQMLAPRVVSLNEAVGDMARMIQRLIGGDIEVGLSLAPEAGRVLVDPGQLHQALINLALNARDAMPGGGRLSIETGRAVLERMEAEGLVGEATRTGEVGIPPGRYSTLTVRDTGQGMDATVLDRLFEPYFTTKEQGRDKGTGLGLSMVYGIVRQSGGYIQVHSHPGRGTAFRILLPEHEESSALEAA